MTIENINDSIETSGFQSPMPPTDTVSLATPRTAADFSFPMEPYDIQLDFMKRLFETIENGRFAIFESPTGTGKSLSIICGALTWLMHDSKRPTASTADTVKALTNEPDWVVAFEKRRAAEEDELVDENEKAEAKYKQWVAKTRRSEAMERKKACGRARSLFGGASSVKTTTTTNSATPTGTKRSVDAITEDTSDVDELLVDAYYSDTEEAKHADTDGPVKYSEAVRRLLERRAADKPYYDSDDSEAEDGSGAAANEVPEEPMITKIFYASRTHSQLQQFVHEVKRTLFASRDRIKCVTLGSRTQLCTNDRVRKESGSSVYALNEKCTEMQQQGSKKKKQQRCPFLPTQRTPMFDFKDSIGRKIMDIEELASEGKRLSVCAYYGSRASVSAAHVVALPYNMLLSKATRESMGVSLKGNIVIVDEAHNLVDTVLAIHSVSLDWTTVQALLDMMQMYFAKYWRRLKGSNTVYIRQAIALLKALDKFMKQCDAHVAVMPVNEFLQKAHADHINVYKIDKYLRASKLGRKLNMFSEARSKDEAAASKRERVDKQRSPMANPATAVATFESFMECIGSPNRLGARLVVNASGGGDGKAVELKYLLLDPSESFGEICKEARAVVLAGGTMKPANDAVEQLLPKQRSVSGEEQQQQQPPQYSMLDPANAQIFAWSHVVAASHICAQVVDRGPTGLPLKFALQDQADAAKLREAGNALAALCNVVPGGVVVFFPSYALLRKMHGEWAAAGITGRISKRKPVFAEATSRLEPVEKGEEDALAKYTNQVKRAGSTGAVLLSVVGGKLSEGINFSDDLGRAVVMVGVPYPSLASPELVERLEYYESGGAGCVASKKSGGEFRMGVRARELYEAMCMRSVNQSIGRAIRHRRDYAAIVFLDCRYAEPRIASKLPAWIAGGGNSVVASKPFGPALANIASFFKRDFSGDN
ncbi:ATP-dependent DNA helicase chl1 [Coemansia sp. RSA 2399]|nr:ATP-dependent DNA helicase chl1 [Coemansia sp. RSA 2399]